MADRQNSGLQNAAYMANAAKSAMRIARGAAVGGLQGAALSAAKEAAPFLLKLAIGLLLFFIVLPMLVFAALPNIFFGFGSSATPSIFGMTQQADNIKNAYLNVDAYNQAEMEAVMERLLADYAESGTVIDRTEVTDDTYHTNVNWLIAINSVLHQQDLFSMDAGSIKTLTLQKLTYTPSLLQIITGEGESAGTATTLKVDFKDMDPAALMAQLGFTEDEKNWATALYQSISEDQTILPGSPHDPGSGIDYGDLTFTDTATEVVYYNQADARWGSKLYGRTGTMASSACGPTALAIVVASLADRSIDPVDVAKWSVQNGYCVEGNGSAHALIPDGGVHYGLLMEALGRSAKALTKALSDGKLGVAIMSKGHFTNGGHFIVLRGMTSSGKILVADPASKSRSEQEWALSIIVSEASRAGAVGGPFWAFSAD
ncbi:MAG: C39 family peptidase [Oscillospiraceae bacterium]